MSDFTVNCYQGRNAPWQARVTDKKKKKLYLYVLLENLFTKREKWEDQIYFPYAYNKSVKFKQIWNKEYF